MLRATSRGGLLALRLARAAAAAPSAAAAGAAPAAVAASLPAAGGLWQLWQRSSSPGIAAAARAFASFSAPVGHGGCGHSHHHDHDCGDDEAAEIRAADDMARLHSLVAASGGGLTAAQAAAAYRRAAQLAGAAPGAAGAVLAQLAAVWPVLLPAASPKDVAGALLAWAKLRLADEQLWAATLAAASGCLQTADGQDLANIGYALAVTSAAGGGVPGVPPPAVAQLLAAVTHEAVSLVSGSAGAGDGCGAGRAVSVGNLATLRWAHETMEELQQQEPQQQAGGA